MEAVDSRIGAPIVRRWSEEIRAIWIRICVFSSAAFMISVANAIRVFSEQPFSLQLLYAVETSFVLLPFAAGFCLVSLRSPTRRSALLIAGVTSLTMIGLDLLPSSDEPWHYGQLAQRVDTGQWVHTPLLARWNSVNGIATVHAHQTGRVAFEKIPGTRYEKGSPRWRISSAYMKLILIPLPFAVVGLVLGLLRGLRRAVLFKSRGVELAAEFLVGWGGTALTAWVVLGGTEFSLSKVVHGGGLPGLLAVPMAVAILISLTGWLPARELE